MGHEALPICEYYLKSTNHNKAYYTFHRHAIEANNHIIDLDPFRSYPQMFKGKSAVASKVVTEGFINELYTEMKECNPDLPPGVSVGSRHTKALTKLFNQCCSTSTNFHFKFFEFYGSKNFLKLNQFWQDKVSGIKQLMEKDEYFPDVYTSPRGLLKRRPLSPEPKAKKYFIDIDSRTLATFLRHLDPEILDEWILQRNQLSNVQTSTLKTARGLKLM